METELSCVRFVEVADALVDLPEARWGESLRRHVEVCPPCRVFLEQLQDLRLLLREWVVVPVGPEDPRLDRVLERGRELAAPPLTRRPARERRRLLDDDGS